MAWQLKQILRIALIFYKKVCKATAGILEKLGTLPILNIFQLSWASSLADLSERNPQSADYARDLWVLYWRLADLSEKNGKAAEAMDWYRKAHDTLAGMKQRGLEGDIGDILYI